MRGNETVEAEGRRCSPTLANPDMMGAQPSAASARPVCPRTKLTCSPTHPARHTHRHSRRTYNPAHSRHARTPAPSPHVCTPLQPCTPTDPHAPPTQPHALTDF
ncbi:hypothetical protein FIBSPDRAFT_570229 [Athelia psychrophila]|uniref:Uncharacterized protein n=1 Tax=Athelia psychrophila TaxID=1759441 RepID=A0A166HQN4_9AGAM|nr:hypothetical protein FIBSPDRAFT_570229 [Fibularhizoctonia sp. CBS 109695]